MADLRDIDHRSDILNRLKRAEGQLRGIQRMVEAGEECKAIATQMSAVRKALDSTYVRMTLCFMQQALQDKVEDKAATQQMLSELEGLLNKLG